VLLIGGSAAVHASRLVSERDPRTGRGLYNAGQQLSQKRAHGWRITSYLVALALICLRRAARSRTVFRNRRMGRIAARFRLPKVSQAPNNLVANDSIRYVDVKVFGSGGCL
jgi:hypothetical protein